MIGGDCYKRLVGAEQHEAAMEQFRRERQEKLDEAFVVQKVPTIVDQLPKLDQMLHYCEALDAFKGRLLPRIGPALHDPLWRHIRNSGELRLVQEFTERTLRDGIVVERTRDTETRYGVLAGFRLLSPPPYDPIAPVLSRACTAVRELVNGEPLAQFSAEERRKAVRKLTRLWREILDLAEEARDLTRFLDLANIRTLRAWAAREDSPVRGYFDIVGEEFRAGKNETQYSVVPIPQELLFERVPELPQLL